MYNQNYKFLYVIYHSRIDTTYDNYQNIFYIPALVDDFKEIKQSMRLILNKTEYSDTTVFVTISSRDGDIITVSPDRTNLWSFYAIKL